MKSKTVNIIIGTIVFILVFVVWKLNDYYKQEKSVLTENQIHQQTLNLKTAISSQLTQLRNIISSYQGQVDESKINWVQINPFYALVQVEISGQNQYVIKNLFVKSGTPAENWSKDYMQKAFSYSRFSNKEIHAQLFQNKNGEKFLALMFSDEKIQNSRRAVVIVGEANYFQKYFDLQRSGKGTNILLTHEAIVVGHTQSDYIATKTQEEKLSANKFFLDKDQIRSSNLAVMSYAPKLARGQFLFVPPFVLIFVFGFALVLIGILLYALRPIQSEFRKAEIFKKVFNEIQQKVTPTPAASAETEVDKVVLPADEERFELPKAEGPEVKEFSLPEQSPDEFVASNLISEISKSSPENDLPPLNIRGIEKIPLSEVVDLALSTVNQQITTHSMYIEKHYESSLSYEVDVERFRKGIENLILNAIEAQAKEIIIKIYDVPGVKGLVTNLDIIDDGQGVEISQMEKIWQPFYGTKDKLHHKGLGLTETLSVARRYGADVKLMQNQIGGVTVRIEMAADNRFAIVAGTPSVETPSNTHSAELNSDMDIDIDSILSLDDGSEQNEVSIKKSEKESVNLEHEFTTTQFKMDQRIEILEDPQINFKKPDKLIDHLDVKVRRPGKS